MKKLRYAEKFYSIQGEGYHVGVPSVFLRTFGCNFRCKHFGRDPDETIGKYNPDVIPVIENLDSYKNFEDLPIVSTGCDTYASIYPEFKRFMMDEDVPTVIDGLTALVPGGDWFPSYGNDVHLVLTGGEPMLGWQKLWPELLEGLMKLGLQNLTIETNTTQPLSESFGNWLLSSTGSKLKITWSCSPKLRQSGEDFDKAIRPDVAFGYYNHSDIFYLKFVVANDADIREAERAVEMYRDFDVQCPVYLMPVGGTLEEYQKNKLWTANKALELGWRYSPRLHTDTFGNAWGT